MIKLIGLDEFLEQQFPPGKEHVSWSLVSPNAVNGNLRLQASSPAINKGSNALALDAEGNPLTTDLDGKTRIINGILKRVQIDPFEALNKANFNGSIPVPSLGGDVTLCSSGEQNRSCARA